VIDLDWLTERLCEVLRWRFANPAGEGGPELPMAGLRVWNAFLDLNATRGSNGFGANPIAASEIESWSRLRREPVRPFELDMLRALDVAFLKAASEKTGKADEPKVSTRKMTVALFDALFGGGKRR
jgi:hypothetical protein